MTAAAAAIGAVLHGRWRIDALLGQGAGTTTYRARDLTMERDVAVKELVLRGTVEWKVVELFEREAAVLSHLSHPSVPEYVAHFVDDDADGRRFYLVRELVVGESLADLIAGGWRADEATARSLATEVLTVLAYLGTLRPQLVHRDIKPRNLIRRETGSWMLVDFGAVQRSLRDSIGGSTIVGTFGYMAPEQLTGRASVSSDLYGLAATLIAAMTGKDPGELPVRRLRPILDGVLHTSPGLRTWLDRCLAPDPRERFASAELAQRELGRRVRVPWRAIGLGGATIIACLGVGSFFMARGDEASSRTVKPHEPAAPSKAKAPITPPIQGELPPPSPPSTTTWKGPPIDTQSLSTAADGTDHALRFSRSHDGGAMLPLYEFPDHAVTVELRFRTDANKGELVSGAAVLDLGKYDDGLGIVLANVEQRVPSSTLIGRWVHVAVAYDRTRLRVYLDGALAFDEAATGYVGGPSPWTLGGQGYDGSIDELRVWNYARTVEQINADRNHRLPAGTTGLVGYWTFDETTGPIIDHSGNGRDGAVTTAERE